MSYFQRVLFNDRLSELDYEIFWKMTWLMKGVTPDKFELVLMVRKNAPFFSGLHKKYSCVYIYF